MFHQFRLGEEFVEAKSSRTVYESINQSSWWQYFLSVTALISDLSKGYAKAVEDLSKIG